MRILPFIADRIRHWRTLLMQTEVIAVGSIFLVHMLLIVLWRDPFALGMGLYERGQHLPITRH